MNIFFTSPFLSECARALDDKRLNKMIVESSQMISTAIRLKHGTTGNLFTRKLERKNNYPYCLPPEYVGEYYKQESVDLVAHPKHPCTLWTIQYLGRHLRLLYEMLSEYKHRFNKEHACSQKLPIFSHFCSTNEFLLTNVHDLYDTIPNCSGHEAIPDIFTAYRNCMLNKWENDSRTPTWINREPPEWVKDGIDLKSSISNGNMMKYYRK